MRYFVQIAGESIALEVEKTPQGAYRVRDATGREWSAEIRGARAGALTIAIGERTLEAQPSDQEVRFGGERFSATVENERDRASAAAKGGDTRGANELRAPMPGRIVRVCCAPGEQVSKGAPLVVIEAMKMQNELKAKQATNVRAVHVRSGDTVERGALLVELE